MVLQDIYAESFRIIIYFVLYIYEIWYYKTYILSRFIFTLIHNIHLLILVNNENFLSCFPMYFNS